MAQGHQESQVYRANHPTQEDPVVLVHHLIREIRLIQVSRRSQVLHRSQTDLLDLPGQVSQEGQLAQVDQGGLPGKNMECREVLLEQKCIPSCTRQAFQECLDIHEDPADPECLVGRV